MHIDECSEHRSHLFDRPIVRKEYTVCRFAVHSYQSIKTNSIRKMIINEKYLQDIDDDDDDDVLSDQPSAARVMGNANANFDHYVRIKYS